MFREEDELRRELDITDEEREIGQKIKENIIELNKIKNERKRIECAVELAAKFGPRLSSMIVPANRVSDEVLSAFNLYKESHNLVKLLNDDALTETSIMREVLENLNTEDIILGVKASNIRETVKELMEEL